MEKLNKRSNAESDETSGKEFSAKAFCDSLEALSSQVSYRWFWNLNAYITQTNDKNKQNLFLHCIFSFPDKKILKDNLHGKHTFKFYEFLNELSLDARIISAIGLILFIYFCTKRSFQICKYLAFYANNHSKFISKLFIITQVVSAFCNTPFFKQNPNEISGKHTICIHFLFFISKVFWKI